MRHSRDGIPSQGGGETPRSPVSLPASNRPRQGQRQNVMAAVVVDDEMKQEVVLYHRIPSTLARQRISRDELVPSLAFALPNPQWRLNPYRRASRADLEGLSDLWVQPDQPLRVFVRDTSGLRTLSVNEAASDVADRPRAGFARKFQTPDNYFGSSRWLPKVHGWPG